LSDHVGKVIRYPVSERDDLGQEDVVLVHLLLLKRVWWKT
jgi:hypothetical protein